MNKADGKGKGFAFVQFQNHDHAVEAYLDNDNTIFQGRLLHIISAKAKKDTKLDEFEISKLPLKKQKEIRRKQEAVKATFNWNSLYLNVSFDQLPPSGSTHISSGRCCNVYRSFPYGH